MVMLDFSDVKEAQESSAVLREGYYPVVIRKATEGVTDKQIPTWSFEYEILSGEDKGETIKETMFLASEKGREQTVNMLSRIKMMYSRILGQVLTAKQEYNPQAFVGKNCVVKIQQSSYTNKHQKKVFKSEIAFAGWLTATDYKAEMATNLKHSAGYLAHLAGGTASTASTVEGDTSGFFG